MEDLNIWVRTCCYRGVRVFNGRYQARIKAGGRELSLGHFDTALEAAKAYDLEQLRRYGGKAQLNLPELRWVATALCWLGCRPWLPLACTIIAVGGSAMP
jgi:hypothetical protein